VNTIPSAEELQQLEEMGPVDWVILGWPGKQPKGELAPLLIDLVDRGIIRILDIAVIAKGQDGTVMALDMAELEGELGHFDGASSGLLGDDDLQEAAAALDPGQAAAVLVWENRWAAPFATAVRRSGGLVLDSGRIPVQALLAALDALESLDSSMN
jgi:hypothetical protein